MLSTSRERTEGVETQKDNKCLTTWVDGDLIGDIDSIFFFGPLTSVLETVLCVGSGVEEWWGLGNGGLATCPGSHSWGVSGARFGPGTSCLWA